MPRPSLCVAFTYFNEGEMLTHGIGSLLAQETTPDSILIYDDASTDPAEAHIPRDDRIKIYRGEENKGPAFGRNFLLSACDCDYIHFHDSDDYFETNWCSAVSEISVNQKPQVIFTDILPILSGEDMGWRIFNGMLPVDLLEFTIRHSLLPACLTLDCKLLREIGGYPTQIYQSEDYLLSLLVMARRPSIGFDPRPLSIVRRRAESRSNDQITVLKDCTRALEIASGFLPVDQFYALAQRAVQNARQQYFLEDWEGARMSFELAQKLEPGPGRFGRQPKHYQLAANNLGALAAERLARIWYRMKGRSATPPSR